MSTMLDPGEQYVNPEIAAATIDLSDWAEPMERWHRPTGEDHPPSIG
jgi:hypothetical protein